MPPPERPSFDHGPQETKDVPLRTGAPARRRRRQRCASLQPAAPWPRNPVLFVVACGSRPGPPRCCATSSCGPRTRVPPGSASPSPCGCGSRCCSPTSPRPSPKVAARRRPTRCARCARTAPRPGASSSWAPDRHSRGGRRRPPLLQQGRPRRHRGRPDSSPSDGEVIEGIASVDESAITGESAPVIRESGGDRSAVTGGTKVLSDRIVVPHHANPGETFLDRMIALVEGAARQKTPNEIALHILLVGLTLIFLFAVRDPRLFRSRVLRRPQQPARHHRGRAARLPHPHHDRWPALGHRHRRHGPPARQATCWPRAAARWRPPATWTCCCSTRPAPSRSATVRPPSSCRRPVCASRSSRTPRSSPASPTRPQKAARSSMLAKQAYGLRGRKLQGSSSPSCRSRRRPA